MLAGLISVRGSQNWPVHEVRSSEFRRVCYRINILGSRLSPSSINLVLAQAGKVTIRLASHWPCVTDTVVYPPMGSTAKDREMSTHAYAPSRHGIIYLLPVLRGGGLFRHTGALRPCCDFLAQCAALLDLWSVSGDE